MFYGLEISEKIEIKHVFRPKTFFPLSNTLQTSCHSVFKINHRFECNYKWLIYLLTFNKCKKQCTSQTKDHFRSRWNKSLKVEVLIEENSISKNICANILKVKIYPNFCNDVSVILIGKADASNATKSETY